MKLEKALLDFDSNQEKRLSHLRAQLEKQQDNMIGKINLLWKTVSEKLNDTSSPENAGSSMAPRSIAAISHDEKEELRKKGIKSPSKLISLKYLSSASIKELKKIQDASSTNVCNLDLGGMAKGKEELKEQGKEENEMEADMEVEEESEFETGEEVEEIIEEDEDDGDSKDKNQKPEQHQNLLYDRSLLLRHTYIDLESPINIMSRRQYNQIMTYELTSRQKPSNPKKISNFVGRIRGLKIFIGSFTYECDFMILEDTTSIIDRHLGEMVFEKPFIDETGLIYDEEKGTIINEQAPIPYPRPPMKKTLGMERRTTIKAYSLEMSKKQDKGDRRGIMNLMRLEKEMMDNKGEVT
ncbi:hypothetical protein Tco_0691133 [Tanacetum coccineum]